MEKRVTYFYAVIVLTISLVVFGNASCAYAAENNRITKGVFIDGVDVGGLTDKEAEEKLKIMYVNFGIERYQYKYIIIWLLPRLETWVFI